MLSFIMCILVLESITDFYSFGVGPFGCVGSMSCCVPNWVSIFVTFVDDYS